MRAKWIKSTTHTISEINKTQILVLDWMALVTEKINLIEEKLKILEDKYDEINSEK